MKLQIIPTNLLASYLAQVPQKLQTNFDALHEAEISTDTFSFYISVASVFSSKIEGEDIELDSYIKHKAMKIEFKPDYTKKTDDLYNAYIFAKQNPLTPQNINKAHALLVQNFVEKYKLGKFRTCNMYVVTDDGRIEYVATSPYEVEKEMQKLYGDITLLLKADLSIQEVFYYAAFIHLIFVKIHPWNDGNGRSARLLEKWFLSQKLGEKAWFLQSEKMYYQQHQTYYKNIRLTGLEYSELDYSRALPFLLMLPKSVEL
jgi:Fic family protein